MRPLLALLVLTVPLPLLAAEPPDFVRDVRPILAKNCFACHGPDDEQRKGKLRLDIEADARKAVGKADDSEVLRRIESGDETLLMPPPESGRKLTPEQVKTLRDWVAGGAKWGVHWSFARPVRPLLPQVKQSSWPLNDIDRFVLQRLEREGLAPSAPADPIALVRRVTLDLTGLPPTPEEVDAFLADRDPRAYEALVDRLLASPAYGERMARMWLDLARYADTKGYEKDRTRIIWRYRDWVIAAFNRDLPFDQFTIEQLAGDLLPGATLDQQIATAFHRNTMCNDEGGTDDEEFRIAAVKDRVDTTLQVWMGLTMGCAKCHSHKFDPLSQKEYYRFYAFFNQTEDADRYDDSPLLAAPTVEQQQLLATLDRQIEALRLELKTPTNELLAALAEWESTLPPDTNWTLSKPSKLLAASGATFKPLEDGSVLVVGKGPAQETYRITLPTDLPQVTGLKLEVLPDPSHPKGGVGRAENDGNFVLSQITVSVTPKDKPSIGLPLEDAAADFSQNDYPVEDALENPDRTKHGWAVSPQQAKPHTAVFSTPKPVTAGPGSEVMVVLDHQFQFAYPGFSIGRFRISHTGDPEPRLLPVVPAAVKTVLETPADKRTAEQRQTLFRHFATLAPQFQKQRERLAKLEQERKAIPVPQIPVMRELDEMQRRQTRRHVRGNFLEPGETVDPGVPEVFPPLPAGAPLNRLGVARWLVSDDNPLTARVMANRLWALFFGTGLVETQEDFGTQGLPPSHPELLDWLAIELREGTPSDAGTGKSARPTGRWSIKSLCRTIVLSATYRQSSRPTPALLARDRDNRLLARGARFRLEAEMVRDSALAVSGLLSRKMFGPSVMPPQPPNIWQSTYNTEKWITPTGDDRFRRGLYTFLKRTSPYPSMTTFDAPSREVCTPRRISTNTPLQALVTLNDPVYIEAAQALAGRAVKEGGATLEGRLTRAFRLTLGRPPQPAELRELSSLYARRLAVYRQKPDDARQMAVGEGGTLPQAIDAAELAALTNVGNVLLNLDEFLTK